MPDGFGAQFHRVMSGYAWATHQHAPFCFGGLTGMDDLKESKKESKKLVEDAVRKVVIGKSGKRKKDDSDASGTDSDDDPKTFTGSLF